MRHVTQYGEYGESGVNTCSTTSEGHRQGVPAT